MMKLTGRLKVGNRIVIPENVNPESIVADLTPHRVWQELYVILIYYGKFIEVRSNSGNNIDCFYIVEAEELG